MRALILGGTGVIGRATARRLIDADWQVDVTGRDPAHLPRELAEAGVRFHPAERSDPEALRDALGSGTDLLVDCVCYTAADARLLLPLAARADSTVLISSKAVYVDGAGNHSNSAAPPDYGGPVPETHPTLPPGEDVDYRSREGYGASKVAAELVALNSGLPISVLRPSRIHGAGANRPREWVFVRRALDRRPAVLLAAGGTGVVHPTAAVNLAALIETVARHPGTRVLNSADPDAPCAREIARAIARQLGHAWREVPLDDAAPKGLGRTPWDAQHPVVLDTTASLNLGYRPVGDFAATVIETVDWLYDAYRAGDPRRELPSPQDPYFADFFDYAAEDAYLADQPR
ncbi:MAG TPA: NAD-dependent epimerase/dehydratase family protein [Actinospica sp.]|nr:NAD-dependent epimerase/dehydratase family protein [Actinospica sp.]